MSCPTKEQLARDKLWRSVPKLVEAAEDVIYRLETYIEDERDMPQGSMTVCLIKLREALDAGKEEFS